MAHNNKFHLFLENRKYDIPYSSRSFPNNNSLPKRNRESHADFLFRRFDVIWSAIDTEKKERLAVSLPVKSGFYVEFKGQPGKFLATKKLENFPSGIRLRNIREVETSDGIETHATVYIPNGKSEFFLDRINQYASEKTRSDKPKNKELIESIEDVVIASQLESFWQDAGDIMPNEEPEWCEVWLSFNESSFKDKFIEEFQILCNNFDIEFKEDLLHFPERIVILIKANRSQLKNLIASSDNIAEFRKSQETASFWTSQANFEQIEWVKDLLARLKINNSDVVVTLLDGGVNNGHPLINPVLSDKNCSTINPQWGTKDSNPNGHGTLMSGIIVYDNLQKKLESTLPVVLNHQLESVKILPPKHHAANPHELWGSFTSQAVSLAEINNQNKKRIICMAVTSDRDTNKGNPSSWSAAIDKLTSGSDDGFKRLIILSGGNIPQNPYLNYPNTNLNYSIQNPAQSMNALTVGGYTQKTHINENKYKNYNSLADANTLSPFSSTSLIWDSKWPFKPDIVMEAGNLAVAPDGLTGSIDDLSSLTTSPDVTLRQFDFINATSEASAHAANLAAKVQYNYPNAWPETIRGLMVHSADWTDEMISQFGIDKTKKGELSKLMRIFGYGVPNEQRALNSFNNNLSLICEESIQPYCKKSNGGYGLNQMHMYKLPWPKKELENLREKGVKIKITLSYFIEPGPGNIGWKDRYRYSSFALRFDLNKPSETEEDFKKRINVAARDSNETGFTGNSWLLGEARNKGSIHSDVWEGTGQEAAESNLIGVYPVVGWWRERTNLGLMEKSTRYSLIVSIQSEEQEIDLYTPIVNMIKLPIEIKI